MGLGDLGDACAAFARGRIGLAPFRPIRYKPPNQ
jgi:hypothetical protein